MPCQFLPWFKWHSWLACPQIQYPDALPTMALDLTNIRLFAAFLAKTEIKFDLVGTTCGPGWVMHHRCSVHGHTTPGKGACRAEVASPAQLRLLYMLVTLEAQPQPKSGLDRYSC